MPEHELDFLLSLPNDNPYLRRNYIGSSDAPAIMGVSPWIKIDALLMQKLGLAPSVFENVYMTRGKIMESEAREWLEKELELDLPAKRVFSKKYDWMMASFDGINESKKIAVEIKCPGKKDHSAAEKGEIPKKYYPQLQHQMLVAELDKMIYLSYSPGSEYVIYVDFDPDYAKEMIHKEKDFFARLQNYECW